MLDLIRRATIFHTTLLPAIFFSAMGCSQPRTDADRGADSTTVVASKAPNPKALVQQSAEAIVAGEYDRAIDVLTNVISSDQASRANEQDAATVNDALYQRGIAYAMKGFPDTAIADFSEVLQRHPNHAEALCRRGAAYLAMKDIYKSLADCTNSIRLSPHNPRAYRTRGEGYLRRGLHERAIADLREALRQDASQELPVGNSLGKAYFELSEQLRADGQAAAADQAFDQAKTFNTDFVANQTADNSPQGVESLDSPTPALGPLTPPEIHAKPVLDEKESREAGVNRRLQKARQLRTAGKLPEAINELAAAIAEQPDKAEPYVERAETWLQLGFPDTALLDAQEAIRRNGGAPAYRQESKAFLELGNYYRAIQSANEALRRGPIDVPTIVLRGKAYLGRAMYDEAVRDLEYALQQDKTLTTELKALLADAQDRREQ